MRRPHALLDVLDPLRNRAFRDPLRRHPARPVGGDLRRHGTRPVGDPDAAARTAGAGVARGVRRGGEAAHRNRTSAPASAWASRPGAGRLVVVRRGAAGSDPRLHAGAGSVGSRPPPRCAVPPRSAPDRRGLPGAWRHRTRRAGPLVRGAAVPRRRRHGPHPAGGASPSAWPPRSPGARCCSSRRVRSRAAGGCG